MHGLFLAACAEQVNHLLLGQHVLKVCIAVFDLHILDEYSFLYLCAFHGPRILVFDVLKHLSGSFLIFYCSYLFTVYEDPCSFDIQVAHICKSLEDILRRIYLRGFIEGINSFEAYVVFGVYHDVHVLLFSKGSLDEIRYPEHIVLILYYTQYLTIVGVFKCSTVIYHSRNTHYGHYYYGKAHEKHFPVSVAVTFEYSHFLAEFAVFVIALSLYGEVFCCGSRLLTPFLTLFFQSEPFLFRLCLSLFSASESKEIAPLERRLFIYFCGDLETLDVYYASAHFRIGLFLRLKSFKLKSSALLFQSYTLFFHSLAGFFNALPLYLCYPLSSYTFFSCLLFGDTLLRLFIFDPESFFGFRLLVFSLELLHSQSFFLLFFKLSLYLRDLLGLSLLGLCHLSGLLSGYLRYFTEKSSLFFLF